MPWIIDGHQDLAYNALTFNRDIRRSAAETRRLEADSPNPARGGHTTVGWPDLQRGQVALIFSSIFQAHRQYLKPQWEVVAYASYAEASRIHHRQLDHYHQLVESAPDKFQLVLNRRDLVSVLDHWDESPAGPPSSNHPIGLVLVMEGAEGIEDPRELETWWQLGLRIIGLVWSGGRFCGGSYEQGSFTSLGLQMLEVMASAGFALDLAHMNEISTLQALDAYAGTVIASHVNARALLKDEIGERQFTDQTIRRLAERDGVMGVVPFNRFLLPGWKNIDDRSLVTLGHLVAQIDHICQITGSARHVALGTDFDGGFGWPAIPLELDTIADLQKLEPLMAERGYSNQDIADIFGGNWERVLLKVLPD